MTCAIFDTMLKIYVDRQQLLDRIAATGKSFAAFERDAGLPRNRLSAAFARHREKLIPLRPMLATAVADALGVHWSDFSKPMLPDWRSVERVALEWHLHGKGGSCGQTIAGMCRILIQLLEEGAGS